MSLYCRNYKDGICMDKGQALKLARQYKDVICDQMTVVDVYMYGSYSKDCATEQSDIDIAVVVDNITEDVLSVMAKLWRATRKVSSYIEPVLVNRQQPSPLFDEILKCGIKI